MIPHVKLRKGLNVDITSAMASEASDKNTILNSIAYPRARTKVLLEDAQAAHESLLVAEICDFDHL